MEEFNENEIEENDEVETKATPLEEAQDSYMEKAIHLTTLTLTISEMEKERQDLIQELHVLSLEMEMLEAKEQSDLN